MSLFICPRWSWLDLTYFYFFPFIICPVPQNACNDPWFANQFGFWHFAESVRPLQSEKMAHLYFGWQDSLFSLDNDIIMLPIAILVVVVINNDVSDVKLFNSANDELKLLHAIL